MLTQEQIADWESSESYYNQEEFEVDWLKMMGVMQMVKDFASITQQTPNGELYASLIEEEYEEWCGEIGETEEDLKELADLVYVCYGYANAMGYDLDEAISRVHHNNVGRIVQPDGSIKRRADGKIIRNKDYPKVELGDLV